MYPPNSILPTIQGRSGFHDLPDDLDGDPSSISQHSENVQVLKGKFAVKPKHYLGHPVFVDPSMEAEYVNWSMNVRIAEIRGGLTFLLAFYLCAAVIDVVVIFQEADGVHSATFYDEHNHLPRPSILASGISLFLFVLLNHFTPVKATKFIQKGYDLR
jgi:hypothetical protein